MARQKLGPKKHARCEQIGGRPYFACLTRGGQEHYTALCTFYDEAGRQFHDVIDYKRGAVLAHRGPGLEGGATP